MAPHPVSVGPFLFEDAIGDTGTAPRAAARLAVEYLGVADALASRFHCPNHDPDDLRQVARLGLLKAAHRYRTGHGHGFVPYAVPTITGELKRYVRDQAWIVRPPRRVQELRLRINSVRPGLAQRLGHDPTARELSDEIGLPIQQVSEALIADATMAPDPIESSDAPAEPEGRRTAVVPSWDEPGFMRFEARHDLAEALGDASERDRELLRLRFVEELTQQEIADSLGVSQMQVSRLLRRLLGRLRRRMAA
ncbi:sigma-70 family RNA polymerase sigma factor [Sinomonas sp. JGH33]|uniref:Sigma-70 family RNA polymerase sigma factor n=1 Tax=Sinomonas terricola TaxID=3110330 RepID=A0ABU5T9Z6_9MICC|nr:sigma-70 family RNA polymerase sigma factor [Sinomonas sp. JGH33]MEA5456513.1 sigma-70 family RNA polymerase sigma factor [Sinomonas sp. JGH33]